MSRNILIVDKNVVVRRSIRSWIERATDWKVCGEAENGEVAVRKVQELRPDIVILDLLMPVMDGLEAARQISAIAPNTAVLMFTMHSSNQLWKAAQDVGIKDVVLRSEPLPNRLLDALREV